MESFRRPPAPEPEALIAAPQPNQAPGPSGWDDGEERPLRSDARRSRESILAAAGDELERDARASVGRIAAAAGVGRSTVYRHFPTRDALERALAERVAVPGSGGGPGGRASAATAAGGWRSPAGSRSAAAAAARGSAGGVRPPGELGESGPLPLEATHVLNEVAPYLLGDQLVAEARRMAGVPAALYVLDIDGSYLLRLAGSEEFPERLAAPLALGPEIAPEGLPDLEARLERELPGCVPTPMWLRGRAMGIVLTIGSPRSSLDELARHGAAALELANGYTDTFDAARRRRETAAAAEVQQSMLPPRIAYIGGGAIAGSVLPSYDVGGDWFDFVENRDGAWLAIADASGRGPTAAGVGAVALGALRSARRTGATLEEAAGAMNDVVCGMGDEGLLVTAIVARWHAPTSTFAWVNCGHPPPLSVARDGRLRALEGHRHLPLGIVSDPEFARSERRLAGGERLLLCSDGVLQRWTDGGGVFGMAGIEAAIAGAPDVSAAATTRAIQEAVVGASSTQMRDDAALVALAVR